MANVKSRIFLKARVCVLNDTSGPKEGAQWHNMHNCVTTCSLDEWNWRFDTAVSILCTGEACTYGTYAEDAVGGLLI